MTTFELASLSKYLLKLNNKVVLVLAASKGLGRAVSTALSAEVAKVIIGSRNEAELSQTVKEMTTGTTCLQHSFRQEYICGCQILVLYFNYLTFNKFAY